MVRALCSLSAHDTTFTSHGAVRRYANVCSLRSSQVADLSGSEHPSTMDATFSPNCSRMYSRVISVSSTVSWSIPAATISSEQPALASISPTAYGCEIGRAHVYTPVTL